MGRRRKKVREHKKAVQLEKRIKNKRRKDKIRAKKNSQNNNTTM